MAEYDLVIRNTTIATAAYVVNGDIGISAGRSLRTASTSS